MKKINSIPLLLLIIVYWFLTSTFNYSLYVLSTKGFGHQYYLILFYFLGEVGSFIIFLFQNKKTSIYKGKVGHILASENSLSTSGFGADALTMDIEFGNNNITEIDSDSNIVEQPFIGMKWISFIIPGILDFLSKFLIINGFHILKMDTIFRPLSLIIFTLIFAKVFLGKHYDNFTKGGCALIIISLLFSSLYYQFSAYIPGLYLKENIMLGLSFYLGGELLSSIQYIIQEKYYMIGEMYFYRVVAYEGLFGLIISFCILIISFFIKCPFNEDSEYRAMFCYSDKIESNPLKMFEDFKNNTQWCILYLLFSFFYSLMGTFLTKNNGVVSRVSVDICRIFFWNFEIVVIKNKEITVFSTIVCIIFNLLIIFGMIICSEFGNNKKLNNSSRYIKRRK